MSTESPLGETKSPRSLGRAEDKFSESKQDANNEADRVNERLRLAIESVTEIEKYCSERVNENATRYALLILAISRLRRARHAIASYLAPGSQPRSANQWWDK